MGLVFVLLICLSPLLLYLKMGLVLFACLALSLLVIPKVGLYLLLLLLLLFLVYLYKILQMNGLPYESVKKVGSILGTREWMNASWVFPVEKRERNS